MLKSFIPLFCSASDRLVERIKHNHSNGLDFNVHLHLELCVVELVCAATFDVHLAHVENGDEIAEKIIETTNM